MNNYKIINNSGGPLGPLNLLEIFGSCDANPQEVTLQDTEEMEFCGEGTDITDIRDRLVARLTVLGSHLGATGLFLWWEPATTVVTPTEPDPAPPIEELQEEFPPSS